MSKAQFTTAVVGLAALFSAGVIATSPVDAALAAVGLTDAVGLDDANPPQPTQGTAQWNSSPTAARSTRGTATTWAT